MKTISKNIITTTLLIIFFAFVKIYSQTTDSLPLSYNKSKTSSITSNKLVGASFLTGYMISHAREVFNLRGANPRGYEFNFNWHLNNDQVWNDCHCYPRIGAFISFYDFDLTDILGYGIAGGINFAYFFGLPDNFNFHIKGKAGVGYLTKPFDKTNHPENMVYSTHFNYLLSIGAGITLKPYEQIEFQIDGSMNHQSNAALLEPNGGINYWALAVSTNYYLDKPDFYVRKIPDTYLTNPKKTRWDLSFSWGISSMPYPMPGQVPMYGVTFARSLQTWRFIAFNFGTEFERNGRAVEITRRLSPGSEVDPIRVSVLSGIEFLMGNVIFSIQTGVYIYRPFKDCSDIYQRWGLVYNLYKGIYSGLNFKSYLNCADHLSARITFSF